MSPEVHRCDLLVIGSGVAGLSVALGVARSRPETRIVLIAKGDLSENNTALAQGGIAAPVGEEDHPETHAQDTMKVGGAESDPEIVRMVTGEATKRIEALLQQGLPFDRDEEGNLALGREGGHSKKRILHIGDRTGHALHQKLLGEAGKTSKILLMDQGFAMDLIGVGESCAGAYVMDRAKGELLAILARNTVLATGGAGRIYQRTSNSAAATGDGFAMAERIGLKLEDMGKVQFHPTAFAGTEEERSFLITEALRGEGARLKNLHGEFFAEKHHPKGDLAPRALLSRAIAKEMERTGVDHVVLDATHFSAEGFRKRFPSIHTYLKERGIDPSREPIPVAPAAHYFCGGVSVDRFGWTGMPGLYACGEVTRTGLHGKDRTPSNSLLEALVFAERIRIGLMNEPWVEREPAIEGNMYRIFSTEAENGKARDLRLRLRTLMNEKAGVRSSIDRLKEVADDLSTLQEEMEGAMEKGGSPFLMETMNMIQVALSVVKDRLATQG